MHDFHAMIPKVTSINANTMIARIPNPVSIQKVLGFESTKFPQRGQTDCRTPVNSSVEGAIVILLILLRESLSVVKRREGLSLAFIAADIQQLLSSCVFW